jgi:hypothetical protein
LQPPTAAQRIESDEERDMNATIKLIACAAAAAPGAVLAAEGDEPKPVSFEVGTGLEIDSNVAVLELDSTSNAGDTAALLDFGVGYDRPSHGAFDLKAGYDFTQSLHDDFDEFDVRIHRGSGTLSYDLGRVDVGANLQYALAELDGREFLTLAQTSPYVSTLLGKRLFLRFAYAYSDKSFAGNFTRDAISDSLSADAYVFVDGLKTYLVFGYHLDDEDALDRQLDYSGHKLNVQLSHRLKAGSREITLKTYLRHEARDYDAPTLSIGAPREDDRYQLEASAELPLTARVRARVGYKHADNRSNLPSVDFGENVYSLTFSATF